MNHTYRLVWSESQTAYVPVPEFARRRGKGAAVRALSAAVVAALAFHAHALPTGGEVSAGQGGIAQSGGSMTVSQQSQNLAINWQSFGIGANESVNFAQPSASAIALNRVLGSDPSQIHGRLTANGQVWLLNPNGVLFGGGAQVNVGGLVASTLNMSDADFLAGKRTLQGSGGSVVNQGSLAAGEGGYVALLGGRVSNEGVIQARLGTVALGAGNRITLDFAGDKLLSLQVDQGAVDALVQNKQLIRADGGTVLMSAKAADGLVAAVVNNAGIIEARTVDNRNGVIKLLGGMEASVTQVDGTLDASAPNGGDGGFIETSGQHVKVADSAVITTAAPQGKTGLWLIDPNDYTIAASGGDITGSALSSMLDASNVTILSTDGSAAGSGDVNVNDHVAWRNRNSLTLSALHSVNVNQPINAGGANVTLRADNTGSCVSGASNCGTVNFSGSGYIIDGRVTIYYNPLGSSNAADANGNGPSYATPIDYNAYVTGGNATAWMLVNDVNQLQAIRANPLAGTYYALGKDIDASGTSLWNDGSGFEPIPEFRGAIDGLGHTISGFVIDRPGNSFVGLFGWNRGYVQNVNMTGGAVVGSDYVGGLIGANSGTVNNSGSSSAVTGNLYVGGLTGKSNSTITNSYSTGVVTGNTYVGGLVGYNESTVSNSYSTGAVNGRGAYGDHVGGLVGDNYGTVSNSYATGTVNGVFYVGGLVARNFGTVSYSYATGSVTGRDPDPGARTLERSFYVGGLVGGNGSSGTVSNSHSSGDVSGSRDVGGLMAENYGTVSNSYATGSVSGDGPVGGLVGINAGGGLISNSYATGGVSGNYWVGGLTGDQQGGSISNSYSTGRVSGTVNYVGGLIGYNRYNGTVSNSYSTGVVISSGDYVGGLAGNSDGIVNNSYWDTETSGRASSAAGTGLTTAQIMQMASFNNWDIARTGGSRAIWRIYEGHTAPLLTGFLTPLKLLDAPDVTVTYNGSAQTGPTTAIAGVLGAAATGTNAGFYNGYYSTQQGYDIWGGNLTIDPAILNTISLNGTRAYDGTANVAAGIFTLGGLVNGESLTLSGVGTIADKNIGTNKPVALGTLALGDGSGSASNYTLSGGTHVATITPAALTVSTSDVTKPYDGTTSAAGTAVAAAGTQRFDTDTLSGGSFAFTDQNAGTNKTVTVGGVTVNDGNGGNNYLVSYANNTTSTIDPKALTGNIVGNPTKVYDGATLAKLTPSNYSLDGVVGGEAVTLGDTSPKGSYNSKNVSEANTVTASLAGATFTAGAGTLLSNYLLPTSASGAGQITPATLTYVADKQTVTQGSAIPTLTGSVTGFVNKETLGFATFATTGEALWLTNAISDSAAGRYYINGDGLTAYYGNYIFVQDPGNAKALTIKKP